MELLGYDKPITFEQSIQGLSIIVPDSKPNAIAPVFRIIFKKEVRTASELLQSMISELEEDLPLLANQTHPYNTGKINSAKLDLLRAAIEKAKAVPSGSPEADYESARQTLADAYRSLENDGLNKGGAFNGVIEENVTTQYLIEGSDFTRSAGGNSRFGAPKNWTVENFDTSLAEGLMLLTPFSADAEDELTRNFVKNYEAAYGGTPIQFAADSYDGMFQLKAALEAGNADPSMSASEICDILVEQMPKIKIEHGLTGEDMTFTEEGEPNKAPKAVVIEGGVYKSIE